MNNKISYIIISIVCPLFFIGHLYCANPAIETFKYETKGKRDPFVPLIGKETAGRPSGLEGVVSIQDVSLEGIAVAASGKNVAILNGQMVKDNDSFGALHIKKISQKSVRLSIDGKDYTLDLQEEGDKSVISNQ